MTKLSYEELEACCEELRLRLEQFKDVKSLLQKSERQMHRLFNNMPGMVYRCDLDENLRPTLSFVSRGSQELFGFSPEECISQRTNVMETLAHPDDLPGMLEEQDSAILERRPYTMSYRVCLDEDQRKWVWDQGECVYDEHDRPTHLEGIMIDISTQKMREYELVQENRRLQGNIGERYKFGSIIGKSKGMQEVFKLIMKASKRNANVIIYGETGTGKDLVASTIHDQSGTKGPYVAVNCGAIPENLMESEFFGHKKGAFSGATADRKGYLAAADGGTLFLDEVGEIDLSLQVKLLRAPESRQYTPVGGHESLPSDFRLIAATNRDLRELVNAGKMRSDFFYRLHVLPIHVPPLRERIDDLPLLIQAFMERILGKDRPIRHIPANLRIAMEKYNWPGNIRELQNVIERYLTFGEMVFSDLGIQPNANAQALSDLESETDAGATLEDNMDAIERRLILKCLEKNSWKKGITAAELGLNLRTFQRKMKKHGL